MNQEQTLAAIGRVVDELNYRLVSVEVGRIVVDSPSGIRIMLEGAARFDITPELIRQYLLPALDKGTERA